MLTIPDFCAFQVPEGVTLDNLWRMRFHIHNYKCRTLLNEANFGCPISVCKTVGGFFDMGKPFCPEHALQMAQSLSCQSGLNIRIGTPLEMVVYKHQKLPSPDRISSLAKSHEDMFLHWDDWFGEFDFKLSSLGNNEEYATLNVFCVQDL